MERAFINREGISRPDDTLPHRYFDEPLPHAKEIKVQTGGLLGLKSIINDTDEQDQSIDNIFDLVQQAIKKYGALDSLPYDEIARKIVQFEGRSRRRSRH